MATGYERVTKCLLMQYANTSLASHGDGFVWIQATYQGNPKDFTHFLHTIKLRVFLAHLNLDQCATTAHSMGENSARN